MTTADLARTKRGEQRVHGHVVLGDRANSELAKRGQAGSLNQRLSRDGQQMPQLGERRETCYYKGLVWLGEFRGVGGEEVLDSFETRSYF